MGHRLIHQCANEGMLMYMASLCPNLVSVHFYAIHFKFHKFLFTCQNNVKGCENGSAPEHYCQFWGGPFEEDEEIGSLRIFHIQCIWESRNTHRACFVSKKAHNCYIQEFWAVIFG